MAGTSQNMKAVIQFGGNLDSSWKRSVNDLNKSLKTVGKQSGSLTKQQTKLAAEIKKSKLAGQDVGALKKRYSELTREIKKAETEQAKLNAHLKKAERLQRFKSAGKGLFRKGLNVGRGLGAMVAPGLAIGGGGVVASTIGSIIAPAATNAETALQANVARSYGVDTETFKIWDNLAKQYDMNGENIADLFEEYLHKAGEYKEIGKQNALQEAFETLGFKAGDMAGLSHLAQFDKIVERALSLQDESKSSFALDSLFGGEASKFLMLIKQSGRSYRELMDEQRRYNLLTKEGADGAVEGNVAFNNLRTVFTSALAEISGQLGSELSPNIRSLTDDLADWFKGGGIKKVVNFLRNDMYPGILTFGQGIVYVGKIVYALAKKLSWLLPDERNDQKDVLTTLGEMGLPLARLKAKNNGQEEWFEQQLKANPDLPETVRRSYKKTRGLFGFDSDDEAFTESLKPYLTPEGMGIIPSWNNALEKNQSTTKADHPIGGFWKNNPDDFSFHPDVESGERNGVAPGNSGEGLWDNLLEKLDVSLTQKQAPQLTDNRKFTYHFEINGAAGQEPRAIGEEVATVVKRDPAFSGDNNMLDGGMVW
ncbi:hypothetical protein [Pantoea stewartii]|uniref:hypothetical protein n=1 Tax=Pantoea stewartii TaxID=66269 RepID=UPI0013901794|nr:hypothetical protein [Pantoea stewartii]